MKSTTPVPVAPASGDRRYTSRIRSRRAHALPFAAVAAGSVLSLVLAACGSSTSSGSSGNSSASGAKPGATLTVADVAPFNGVDAALGPTYLATCYGATSVINANG